VDRKTAAAPILLLFDSVSRISPRDAISDDSATVESAVTGIPITETSDQEERSREGYAITTHYQFSPDENFTTKTVSTDDKPLIELRYAPRADIWRINHGWLRSGPQERNGFTTDPETGQWHKREDDDDVTPDDATRGTLLSGVRPYVRDTRNILLLRVPQAQGDQFLITLACALQRGIQLVYQVEEQEVAVELIGEGDQQRLLLWEAAEGGTGVWERIVSDPGSFATIAREALRVCHFDPETGEEKSSLRARSRPLVPPFPRWYAPVEPRRPTIAVGITSHPRRSGQGQSCRRFDLNWGY
jgi:hypothetical protein